MNLWIRSQDREELTICRDLSIGGYENNEIIADAGCSIGEYKTKERALEVLDEIDNVKLWKYMASLNFVIFIKTLEEKYNEKEKEEIFKMMNTYEMPLE